MDTSIGNNIATDKSLYDTDFYQWVFHNANLLRQGKFTEIDIDNVVEELESIGRSEKRELRNRLSVLIIHLLKWQYYSENHSKRWITAINFQRMNIELLLEDSPSLKDKIDLTIKEAFESSIIIFEYETETPEQLLPKTCPYTFKQLIDNDFWPKKLHKETI